MRGAALASTVAFAATALYTAVMYHRIMADRVARTAAGVHARQPG
jgi:hypothetical protein